MPDKKAAPAADFQPLAPLLESISSAKRAELRARLASLERGKLLDTFNEKFACGARNRASRAVAYLIAEHLVQRGIPPCFWRSHHSKPANELQVAQQFDLLIYDLLWMRGRYPSHARKNRYERYRALFAESEATFHNAAQFLFWGGKRLVWRIVASLSMTKAQQWECVWLRSVPIQRQQAATNAMRDQVFTAIRDDLAGTRRTDTFTEEDALASLRRRHALWLCSRMDAGDGPTQLAARYEQLTGQAITRQLAAKQLAKVREMLAQNEMTFAI